MRVQQLNFRHLRAFREVAACRSISAACERVHLSQPAITQAIAKLETQLDTTLFDRRSDGMSVTAAGSIFSTRVERALRIVRQGAQEASRLRQRKSSSGFANFDELLSSAQLRAIVAVSRARNFSLAARAEGVSQPALYRAARDLEKLCGIDLYSRTVHGIDLTPAGAALAQAVNLAFSELRQGISELNALSGQNDGQVVVASTPLPRSLVLPRAIDTFLADYQQQEIRLLDGPYDDLLQALRHGECDMMIGALRSDLAIDDVQQEVLFSDRLAVVCGQSHPLAGEPEVHPRDLTDFQWVLPRTGTPTRAIFERLFDGQDLPAVAVETSSMILVRELLRSPKRLTLISAHQVQREIRMGLLTALPVEIPGSERPIGLTLRRDWQPTAPQSAFLDRLREAASDPDVSA